MLHLSSGRKWKTNNVVIYSHALLRIHVIGGQRLKVGEDCSSLPVSSSQRSSNQGLSSPPSRLMRSSAGVMWMCRASFTNSSCRLSWSSTYVVSFQQIGWAHACSATAEFSIIPLSQASRCSFSLVSSLCRLGRSCRRYHISHWIVYQEVMYPSPWLISSGESPGLKDYSDDKNILQTRLMSALIPVI